MRVLLAPDCIGPEVKVQINRLSSGETILLENLRFHSEEEKNDPAFAGSVSGTGRGLCQRRVWLIAQSTRIGGRDGQPF